jgi:hypothetical protein
MAKRPGPRSGKGGTPPPKIKPSGSLKNTRTKRPKTPGEQKQVLADDIKSTLIAYLIREEMERTINREDIRIALGTGLTDDENDKNFFIENFEENFTKVNQLTNNQTDNRNFKTGNLNPDLGFGSLQRVSEEVVAEIKDVDNPNKRSFTVERLKKTNRKQRKNLI